MKNPPFLGTRRLALGLLLLSAYGAPALAGDGDALHPYVGVVYSHDDNLLRLPDGASDNGLRGDNMQQATAGLIFDHSYSLQELFGSVKLNKVRFERFSQLDYDGKEALGRWNWQVGPDWSGRLEGAYNQVLAPYTDFHSNERNLRNEHRAFFEAMWRFAASMRVRGAVQQDKFTYDLASQQFNNRTEKLSEFGVDWLARSGNYAGLVARRLRGDFPNKHTLNGVSIDEGFDQDELKARVNWKGSGITTVDVLAGWARRKHKFFTERDASGANGRATVTWAPHGKTTLTAAAWREFAPIESNVVSYSLNKGASLAAAWQVTGKSRVDASTTYERRAFNARVALPSGVDFSDSLRTHSVGVTTNPTRHIQLSLTAYRQTRGGSAELGLGSFKANGVSFSANAQF
ncbi:MAG: XrtB/PEP-CTERM-associated polysaccharide biosynthesis outer membrane protein EpsL [Telluria sp.]